MNCQSAASAEWIAVPSCSPKKNASLDYQVFQLIDVQIMVRLAERNYLFEDPRELLGE
jgi:hypothetical protein